MFSNLFTSLLVIHLSSFEKYLIRLFVSFKARVFVSFLLICVCVLNGNSFFALTVNRLFFCMLSFPVCLLFLLSGNFGLS